MSSGLHSQLRGLAEVAVSEADAADALRAAAFTAGDRTLIHTLAGGIGADWDLATALDFNAEALRRVWMTSLRGHDLCIVARGRVVFFDVPRPERGGRNDA